MSRKSTTRRPSILRDIQNQIRGSNRPFAAVSHVRKRVPIAELPTLITWLPSVRRNGRGVFQNHFPAGITDLRRHAPLEPVSLEREVVWARLILQQHGERLSRFVDASTEYASELVQGHYEECRVILDGIEQRFGYSLWSIETRVALLQLAEGLEAQKAYVAQVAEERGRYDLLSFLTYQISHRNEPSTTPFRFIQQFEGLLNASEIDSDLRAYLLFHVVNRCDGENRNISAILRCETSSALVDYYDTFICLAQMAMVYGDEQLRRIFTTELNELAKAVRDPRIGRALFLETGVGEWLTLESLGETTADDAMALGDYGISAKAAETALASNPLDASMWVLRAKALAAASIELEEERSPTLTDIIIRHMRNLVDKTEAMKEAIIELPKLGLNHRLHGFSSTLDGLFWRELTSDPENWLPWGYMMFLNGAILRPSSMAYLPTREHRRVVAFALADGCVGSGAFQRAVFRADLGDEDERRLIIGPVVPVTSEAKAESAIGRALSREDYTSALDIARNAAGEGSPVRLYDRAFAQYIAYCLLKLDRVQEMISFTVSRSVADPGSVHLLPIRYCAEHLDKATRRQLAGELSTPILLDLFAKHVDDRLNDLRSYAYEDFLIAHGLKYPSELAHRVGEFDRNLLVYYLRHVCVPSIMQASSVFSGTRELEDERKAVLSLLVALDSEETETYETELREIARAQLIRRGVRHVEQSKIFVDVAAIRRSAEKMQKENFVRYQALLRAGMGPDNAALNEALHEALLGKPLPKEFLEVPKNESTDLLLQILRWMFTECTTNPEYGLDCYLSMRIRHGTLSGQLRTPLEVEKIITQRASGTESYEANLHWNESLSHLDPHIRRAIDARLADFSADYDNFIARIANELIQIRSTEKPEGLFDVSLKSVRFHLWVASLTIDMTFDAFFDRCLELFWESVETCLDSVRNVIDTTLKGEVVRMFSKLETEISEMAGGIPTPDLDRAIRTSQTGAQHALDLVKDWFRLSKPLTEPTFPVEDLIDVGLQCVRTIHRDFTPIVKRHAPPLPPFAGALTLFSDIFFIIFDNIRRHSGTDGAPEVEIDIADLGDRLRMVTRSEIAAGVCTAESRARLDRIKKTIANGDYQRAVSSEGGTGLIKLRKLIGNGGRATRRLDFGYDGGNRFYVDLDIGKQEVTL